MQKFSWLSKKLACVFNFRQSLYKVKNTLVDLAEKLRGYKYRELFNSIYPESLQQACCFSSLNIDVPDCDFGRTGLVHDGY